MKKPNFSEDVTEKIAAQEIARQDRTPFTFDDYANVRRDHTATNRTNEIARQMVDAAQAFEGVGGPDAHLSDLVSRISPASYRAAKARHYGVAPESMPPAGFKVHPLSAGDAYDGGGSNSGGNSGGDNSNGE